MATDVDSLLGGAMGDARQTEQEANKALDALAALSMKLSCQCDAPPHTLVLPAGKLREACATIDEAVVALKKILFSAAAAAPGPASIDDRIR
jgi:hypothetical protein